MKIGYLILGIIIGCLVMASFSMYLIEKDVIDESIQENKDKEVNVDRVEYYVESLVNYRREQYNKNPLNHSRKLSDVSNYNTRLMLNNDYVSHTDINGDDPIDRVKKYNIDKCSNYGENLIKTAYNKKINSDRYNKPKYINEEDELARSIVNGWMNSTGHRKNILKNDWKYYGTDIGINSSGVVFVTQMYCS